MVSGAAWQGTAVAVRLHMLLHPHCRLLYLHRAYSICGSHGVWLSSGAPFHLPAATWRALLSVFCLWQIAAGIVSVLRCVAYASLQILLAGQLRTAVWSDEQGLDTSSNAL